MEKRLKQASAIYEATHLNVQGGGSSPVIHHGKLNPDVAHAITLNESSKLLQSRLEVEKHLSKQYLKSAYQHSSAADRDMVGETEFRLRHFIRLKADTRALLSFYRDEMAVQLSTEHDDELIQEIERELIAFESLFDVMSTTNSDVLLRQMIDLVQRKDDILLKICGSLLSHYGYNPMSSENEMPQVSQLASKDLPQMFFIFNRFKTLETGLKQYLSESRPADLKMTEISALKKQIMNLETDLEQKTAEANELLTKVDLLASTRGRFSKLAKQHEEILQLNNIIRDQKEEISRHLLEHRRMTQVLANKSDQLRSCESQLATARGQYMRDIKALLPVVEKQHGQINEEYKEIQTLRNDLAMGVGRITYTDRLLKESEDEIVSLNNEVARLAKLYVSDFHSHV